MADWQTFIQNERTPWMLDDEVLINFEEIPYDEALKYTSYRMASHALMYAKDPENVRWGDLKKHAAILMQLRFDGQLGFPGGFIEPKLNEPPVEGLNRELEEEIGLDLTKHAFTQENFIMSSVKHKIKLVTFFYAKEVTLDELGEIEKRTLGAMDWGHETAGTIRVPLIHVTCTKMARAQGLPLFLTNRFAGNAKIQLLETINRLKIVPQKEMESMLKVYMDYCTLKLSQGNSSQVTNSVS